MQGPALCSPLPLRVAKLRLHNRTVEHQRLHIADQNSAHWRFWEETAPDVGRQRPRRGELATTLLIWQNVFLWEQRTFSWWELQRTFDIFIEMVNIKGSCLTSNPSTKSNKFVQRKTRRWEFFNYCPKYSFAKTSFDSKKGLEEICVGEETKCVCLTWHESTMDSCFCIFLVASWRVAIYPIRNKKWQRSFCILTAICPIYWPLGVSGRPRDSFFFCSL